MTTLLVLNCTIHDMVAGLLCLLPRAVEWRFEKRHD
jgi:hypothetical protein